MVSLARKWYRWCQLHLGPIWRHPGFRLSMRLLVSLTALSYVGWRLWQEQETLAMSQKWLQQPVWLGVAIALLPLNVGMEARKWRILLRGSNLPCSWRQAWWAILAGAATGIFTPNRIGDYAGRLLPLPPGHRLWAAVFTFVCRISQMTITILLGTIGLWTVIGTLPLPPWLAESYWLWAGIATILAGIGWAGFMWPTPIQRILHRLPLPGSLLQRGRVALTSLSPPLLRRVWWLSFWRGWVFVGQYTALLLAFGFSHTAIQGGALASATLLIKSLAPSIALAELGIRESVALAVMGLADVSAQTIVAATFALFLINLILPALLGLVIIGGKRS